VPLSLTRKERRILATLLVLLLLGLLGMILLGEKPPKAPEPPRTSFARPGFAVQPQSAG
jgi:hypothetical protein